MKVLVISDYRSTHTVRPEAEIFISLAKLGMDISIMTYAESAYTEAFRQAGIEVIDFHPQHKFNSAESKRIREYLLEGQFDILYLFNGKAIYNGLRASKGLPIKVILYRGYTGNIHWWDPSAYLKFLHPRVDAVVCNSKGVAELIKSQSVFTHPQTATINKGHKLKWYAGIKASTKSELGLPENAFVVVCVANARRMKGIPYLLKATYHIPQDAPVHFLLVGKGLEDAQAKRLAAKSPMKDRIHFLGFRKDALSIVKMADVFMLASIKGESITKSVIEAMALETAPIITDIPGNVELVENGHNGLVVPAKNPTALAQAVVKLYKNPDLVKQYSLASQKRIETHLHHEMTVEKTKALFEQLVKED